MFLDNAVAIDGNLTRNPISGDVKTKTKADAVIQHIELLLNMGPFAIPFAPYVCADLRSFLFEEFTPFNLRLMKSEINRKLRHEPRAEFGEISLTPKDDENELIIEIPFKLFDTDKSSLYKSTLRRIV